MINIERMNNGKYCIRYNDNGKVRNFYTESKTMIPVRRKTNGRYIKKVRDIYTKKDFYVKIMPNKDYPLTIPYKIHTNKEKIPFYDTELGLKLIYFDKLLEKDIIFPKHLYYDIETTSLEPNQGIITSIVFIDENDNIKTFINDDNEKKMLNDVKNYLASNNIMSLIGFNSKEFDDDYLAYRMRVNGVSYNPIMSSNIDVMKMCNKLFVKGSLASIAKQLGVIEKIELETNPIKLYYDGDFDILLEYNIRDVEVTKAITEKMNILPFCKALWELSWCDFRHLNSNSRLNDSYFNKRLWEDNLMISKADLEYKGNFGGGFNYYE